MPRPTQAVAALLLAATVAAGGGVGCAAKKKPVDPQVQAQLEEKRQAKLAEATEQREEAAVLHRRAQVLADSAASFRAKAVDLRAQAADDEREARRLLDVAHELDLDAASAYAAGLAYDDLLDRDRAAVATATGESRTARAAACRASSESLRDRADARLAHADQLDADALVAVDEARELLAQSKRTHAQAKMKFASVQ